MRKAIKHSKLEVMVSKKLKLLFREYNVSLRPTFLSSQIHSRLQKVVIHFPFFFFLCFTFSWCQIDKKTSCDAVILKCNRFLHPFHFFFAIDRFIFIIYFPLFSDIFSLHLICPSIPSYFWSPAKHGC